MTKRVETVGDRSTGRRVDTRRWMSADEWLALQPELPDDFGLLWQEGTGTPAVPQSSLYGVIRGQEDLPDGWHVAKVSKPRKAECVFCGSVLNQSEDKPRLVCGSVDCQRKLKAAQKQRQRKRGKPSDVRGCGRFVSGDTAVDYPRAESGLRRTKNPVSVSYFTPR